MIEHVPKDDRDRMNRKVSKLLQLGIIPDDTVRRGGDMVIFSKKDLFYFRNRQ